MRILVVNAGSSSLKLRLLGDGDAVLATRDLPPPELSWGASEPLRSALVELGPVDAVGHRVVHGGTEFVEPVVVDVAVLERIRALSALAPLHQPASIAGIEAVAAAMPGTPQVACFDTAFHAGLQDAAATYALPAQWRERRPLRRFGFHGLSHAYLARRAAELLGRTEAGLRVVTCHLGAGASLTAVADGRSVDTTMGFTPLEGLVMATRSGDVDPGLLLWLQQHAGFAPETVAEGLERRSGLLGLAGSADMREVLAAAAAGAAAATLAVEVYLHRLRKGIAAMTASLGGLDALVFSGGVGEHATTIRARTAAGLGFLGVAVDDRRNEADDGDREIGAPGGTVATLVIESREDLEIARQVRALLGKGS
ncbi:MAG: acetate/propionate family kinase [Chloroflexi bacterium]|nr:acetate/propionate family kinase [Chloroflexota bacterium]